MWRKWALLDGKCILTINVHLLPEISIHVIISHIMSFVGGAQIEFVL